MGKPKRRRIKTSLRVKELREYLADEAQYPIVGTDGTPVREWPLCKLPEDAMVRVANLAGETQSEERERKKRREYTEADHCDAARMRGLGVTWPEIALRVYRYNGTKQARYKFAKTHCEKWLVSYGLSLPTRQRGVEVVPFFLDPKTRDPVPIDEKELADTIIKEKGSEYARRVAKILLQEIEPTTPHH